MWTSTNRRSRTDWTHRVGRPICFNGLPPIDVNFIGFGEQAMTDGIRRAGPPLALQKFRENFYLVQVQLTETPSADWKRLFYDAQQLPPPEFPPRAVEISGHLLRFRSDAGSVE